MSRKRVLVVDDDAGTRLTIRKFLEYSKSVLFDVSEAADGASCLETLGAEDPFDLILLDVEMPDMDGYEVCRAIRETDHEVPIIFVTAHADVEHRVMGREAGGDSFLPKPVREPSLLSLINLFLNAPRKR